MFLPLLIIALGLIALLQALEVFPPAIADLLGRAWPLIPVLVGLAVLLDQPQRLRRWAWPLALILSAALLAGVVAAAYTSRAATERDENVVTFEQALGGSVLRLQVVIHSGPASVEVSPSVLDEPVVNARFVGSTESQVTTDYTVEGGTATFTLTETRPNPIPLLEAVGRGRLTVELPLGLPLDLVFANTDGDVSLNLLGLSLARLDVTVGAGGLLLSLPREALLEPGRVTVGGDVTVFVPEGLGLRLNPRSGQEPIFPEDRYLYLRDGTLLSRDFDDRAAQTELTLTAGGVIRVQ